ncbi:putative RING zinc finger domain superfamily protein isoform X5 [Zea mays]|uniref:putative RING zinc finger domain superfamily protein isoform X5 n=1 Tax=Zea mays TaxID=4577 RepID=UPI0009AA4F21|nr:putative RING zinc finger domain superfamily protein isoform X5 [Zea mays]|eukprot:XP_020408688.1 putative RING zinc finger domain superfamily protein isoform X2 [Zea mays]
MGGCCCCCCSARASDSDRAPHRQNPEEHAPLSSAFDGPSPTSAIVAVDTNLDTPSLDTYRAPPAPLPYDVCFTVSENPDVEKSGIKIKTDGQQSPKVDEFESCEKGAPEDKADEEEDVCPICLEGLRILELICGYTFSWVKHEMDCISELGSLNKCCCCEVSLIDVICVPYPFLV